MCLSTLPRVFISTVLLGRVTPHTRSGYTVDLIVRVNRVLQPTLPLHTVRNNILHPLSGKNSVTPSNRNLRDPVSRLVFQYTLRPLPPARLLPGPWRVRGPTVGLLLRPLLHGVAPTPVHGPLGGLPREPQNRSTLLSSRVDFKDGKRCFTHTLQTSHRTRHGP